jgi:hypothetical protein
MGSSQMCLFCDNIADSKEDVLPVWIQEKVKGKCPILVNGFSGNRPIVMQGMRSNLKTTCVCENCNGGWMSSLEGNARRILGPLMEDIHLVLNGDQQFLIAKWAVKTAMTAESFNRTTRKLFYTRDECSRFRESWTFPNSVLVCLGRYAGTFDLGVFGIDAWDNEPNHPDVTHSYVTTLQFKRVVIQVVCVHPRKDLQGTLINLKAIPGPWQQSIFEVRPVGRLFWPPPLSFVDNDVLSLQRLVYRFSTGGSPINPLRPDE